MLKKLYIIYYIINFIYNKTHWEVPISPSALVLRCSRHLIKTYTKQRHQIILIQHGLYLQIPTYTETRTQYLHNRNTLLTSFVLNHIQIKDLRTKRQTHMKWITLHIICSGRAEDECCVNIYTLISPGLHSMGSFRDCSIWTIHCSNWAGWNRHTIYP